MKNNIVLSDGDFRRLVEISNAAGMGLEECLAAVIMKEWFAMMAAQAESDDCPFLCL